MSESSEPVGSSARMIGGSLASARATATRWRCPPESWSGRLRACSARPSDVEQVSARARASPPRDSWPSARIGSITFSSAENSGSRKWNWNTKPSIGQPRQRALVLVHVRRGAAADAHLALGRQVEQAQQVEQRRLAGAGRAGDGDELVVADREVDVVHQRGRHDAGQDARDARSPRSRSSRRLALAAAVRRRSRRSADDVDRMYARRLARWQVAGHQRGEQRHGRGDGVVQRASRRAAGGSCP